jgi:hypothetical protein
MARGLIVSCAASHKHHRLRVRKVCVTCRRRHGLTLALIFGLSACRDINVTTQHNDVNRTGAYVVETELTPKTVREQELQEAGWGGTLAHWVPPTIANGRVFLATNEYLIAYGLCSRGEPCPASGPHQPVSGCTGCHSQGRMLDILRTTRSEDFPNGAAMRGFAAPAFRDLSLPPRYAKTIVLEGEGVRPHRRANASGPSACRMDLVGARRQRRGR